MAKSRPRLFQAYFTKILTKINVICETQSPFKSYDWTILKRPNVVVVVFLLDNDSDQNSLLSKYKFMILDLPINKSQNFLSVPAISQYIPWINISGFRPSCQLISFISWFIAHWPKKSSGTGATSIDRNLKNYKINPSQVTLWINSRVKFLFLIFFSDIFSGRRRNHHTRVYSRCHSVVLSLRLVPARTFIQYRDEHCSLDSLWSQRRHRFFTSGCKQNERSAVVANVRSRRSVIEW